MFSPNSSEADIAAWVNSQYNQARTARMPFERVWFTNMAFYFGKQWVVWGQAGSYQFARMVEPPAPPWRVRLTINKVRGYTSRELARFHSTRPRGFVMPSSDDTGDQAKAKIGEQIYQYMYEEVDLEMQQAIASMWAILTGNGYLKVTYSNEWDAKNEVMGKIIVDPITPFNLLVPYLDEPQLNRQPWIMHCVVKDPDWVEATYGVRLKPEDSNAGDLLEDRMLNAMSLQEKKATTQGILLKEVWIQPCLKFPDGAVVTVAQDKVLVPVDANQEDQFEGEGPTSSKQLWIEWPYAHKEYPFHQRIHTLANRFYATTFLEDLISLQRQYNRSISQVVETVNKMSRPTWVVPKGSVDVRTMTSEPGAIIQYNPGTPVPPKQEQPASLPNYVFEIVNTTKEEMDGVASQHAVSQGTVPPNVEAATAISYLQERDDATLWSATRSLERSHQTIGKQILSLVAQFWDAERMIKVTGPNQNFSAFLFKGADLANNTDFRVVPGSGAPISRAARKAELLELMKMGMIPPAKGLAYLDMPELGSLYEELQIDHTQASKENLKMSKQVQVQPNLFDEHLIHIETHDDYMKTEEYESLDPQTQMGMRVHTYNHLKILTHLFGLAPAVQENPQAVAQDGGIDMVFEAELRRLYTMLKSTGGQLPPPPPTGGPSAPA